MTIRKYFGLLILVLSLAVASGCKKDKDEPTPVPPENSDENNSSADQSMTADINGYSFSSESATARYRTNGQFTIRATDDDDRSFFFVINSFSGAVTYSFGVSSQNLARYEYNLNGQNIDFRTSSGGTGTLAITDYNEAEQHISGTFSFSASQVTAPDNYIEVTSGEFNEVPITSLQMPGAGEAVFYYNDQLYEADSVKATLLPPYTLEVKLYHDVLDGWFRTYRSFNLFPEYSQNAQGYYDIYQDYSFYTVNFQTEYNLESNVISQTMRVEQHESGTYDLEYSVSELPLNIPYQAESGTVLFVNSDQEETVFTNAHLSPDENGHYELTATNNQGETLTIDNITEEAYILGNHIVSINNGFTNYYICSWQESELGGSFYSIEACRLNPWGIPDSPRIIARDIPIVE